MMERSGLSTSRWLDAIWEPNAQMHTLPNGIDMLDVTGDGDARLIAADLTNSSENDSKLRVFKGGDQATEHVMPDIPCAVVGFYTENNEKKSAALAIGAGASVFIFKNMRPHFKFCLPQLTAHQKEQDLWYKASLDEELNVATLADDLEMLLVEIGAAHLSPRTLKFLSLDLELRKNFAEQYRRLPLVKMNVVTIVGSIRKDSLSYDVACSNLIVGTEFGEILILDPRAFFLADKFFVGWPPVAVSSSGLWSGDGQIIIAGRDGRIGAIKSGGTFTAWETLSEPVVGISSLTCDGVAVATMNGSFLAFSKRGDKLWRIQLPGNPLDISSLSIPQSGLLLQAISIAGAGVRIYDQKHHVDTIKTLESVSALKYGRLGHEERTLAMVTCSGGLSVKILKRTAAFSARVGPPAGPGSPSSSAKLLIPKKSKLFIEQTIRERADAASIHTSFQQGFLRLRLDAARRARDAGADGPSDRSAHAAGPAAPVSLHYSLLGLGPSFALKLLVTNATERPSPAGLLLVCRHEPGAEHDIRPRILRLPLVGPGLTLPLTLSVTPAQRLTSSLQVLLCAKRTAKPLAVLNVLLPVAEQDIEV